MMLRLVTVAVLGLSAALPTVALAGDGDRGAPARVHRDDDRRDSAQGVYVAAHYERREVRREIPAVTREQWVPDRYEEVRIPAVTQTVEIPAVTERCWVPELTERCFVPGHWETHVDARGRSHRDWVEGRYETRVVRAGHYEERIVRPARCEVRVIVPERCEQRLVERGHRETVIVVPCRTVVAYEDVWVPGCWERSAPAPHRRDRDRDDDRDNRGRHLGDVLRTVGDLIFSSR